MWSFNSLEDALKGLPLVQGVFSQFQAPHVGGNTNPYAASIQVEEDEKSYNVVTFTKINGLTFGMFIMSTSPFPYRHKWGDGNHAEDGFLSAYEEFTKTKQFVTLWYLSFLSHKKLSITLKQNKTPCSQCAPKLIKFTKETGAGLRIKAMMQYTGGAKPKGTEKQATQLLVQNNIPVIPCNLPKKVAAKKYDVNAMGQMHELKYVRYDEAEYMEEQDQKKVAKYRNSFDEQEVGLAKIVLEHLDKTKVDLTNPDAVLKAMYKNQDLKRFTKEDMGSLESVTKRMASIWKSLS